MRIVIDLTSLSFHMTGIERYASCVTEEILKQDKINEYVLIFRNEVHQIFKKSEFDNVKKEVIFGDNKLFFYQFILKRKLNKIKADKYLFFSFPSPIFFRKKGIINTIHDATAWDCPKSMKFLQRLYWKINIKNAVRVSEHIITVSNFSKNRIITVLKYDENKIIVAYPGVYKKNFGEKIAANEFKTKFDFPEKYLLTLSTLEPRKNLEMLLKAFSEIQNIVDYSLVLVGRKGWKIDDLIKEYNVNEKVIITGFIEDKYLSSIYKNAFYFVFPSLYEGFGLPPIESISYGTPVISSNAASLPEVLMDNAIYFNPNDKDELKKILLKINTQKSKVECKLNDFQKNNFDFSASAKKVIKLLK